MSSAAPRGAAGTLYVVATPIGNLGDITYRAVEVLRACPVVAAEDTRSFRVLAERYGLHPRRVVRCDAWAEARAIPGLLSALRAGEDVALTTDAGTPGIADPGDRLVRAARDAGLPVVPLPGPCAPVAALSASGLPAEPFAFAGFPPTRPQRLREFLAAWLSGTETVLLLESPERVLRLLGAIAELDPARPVVVARELTKVHEEFLSGTPGEVRERLAQHAPRVRGEIVVVVAPAPAGGAGEEEGESMDAGGGAGGERLARRLLERPWAAKLSRRDLADLLAVACGLGRNEAYRRAHEGRGEDGERR